jgi:hypothetical protein
MISRPHLSAKGRGGGVPLRRKALVGCGLFARLGRKVARGLFHPFFLFFLILFLFSLFFCIFCKTTPMSPNKILKFSIIQSNLLNQ